MNKWSNIIERGLQLDGAIVLNGMVYTPDSRSYTLLIEAVEFAMDCSQHSHPPDRPAIEISESPSIDEWLGKYTLYLLELIRVCRKSSVNKFLSSEFAWLR